MPAKLDLGLRPPPTDWVAPGPSGPEGRVGRSGSRPVAADRPGARVGGGPEERIARPADPAWRTAKAAGGDRRPSARFDGTAGFLVQQLTAESPVSVPATPDRTTAALAAYRSHLAPRISYTGPITPVDLHV